METADGKERRRRDVFSEGSTDPMLGARALPQLSSTNFDHTSIAPQLAPPLNSSSMANSTALRAFRSVCASCRPSLSTWTPALARPLSQSHALAALKGESLLDKNLAAIDQNMFSRANSLGSVIPNNPNAEFGNLAKGEWEEDDRHHIHIYAHKHNTHITLTDPSRNPMVSVSCGNIGFKKAGRGTYDAAYQLAAFVMLRIKDMGWLPKIQKIELVYRGFGKGREAVTKAILGSEGKDIRPLINKLSDSTRLKFGGTRSKKPRRLG